MHKPVTIIGAGFSGLSAAYCLNQAGYAVELYEQAPAPGGLIGTRATPWGLAETAASGALNTARFEALALDLGVHLLWPGPQARKRYVFRGRPRRFPLNAAELPGLARLAARFVFARDTVRPHARESVRAWATRVAGAGVSRYLIEAALQGIYSGNPERLSASLILGRFFEPGPREGKPTRRGIVAPEHGMGELIDALRRTLESRGVVFRMGTAFSFDKAPPAHPHVVATGAAGARAILRDVAPELVSALEAFDLSTMLTATVFFRHKCLTGYGCLFPPAERRRALGVLVNTDIYPNRSRDHISETWILGGAPGASAIDAAELMTYSDEKLLALILEERRSAFGRNDEPAGFSVTRWREAIPHYTVDLEAVLPRLEQGAPNLFLHGNYMGHIGLAKILDRASALPDLVAARGRWE